MVLNWSHVVAGKPVILTLQKTGVFLDIAMLEGIAGIETALAEFPFERLCFGSYAPVFLLRIRETQTPGIALSDPQLDAIAHGNALAFSRPVRAALHK